MKKATLNKCQLLFEEALRAGIGIKVRTTVGDTDRLKQQFYRAKKKLIDAGMTDYNQLQFVTPHQEQNQVIWIVKKGTANE